MLPGDDLSTMVVIVEIRVELAGERDAAPGEDLRHGAVRIGDHRQARRERGVGDAFGDRLFALRHAEQGAMRLHMREGDALRRGESLKGARLVEHERRHFIAAELHFTAAEPFPIRQAGMSADRDAVALGRPHRLAHDNRV